MRSNDNTFPYITVKYIFQLYHGIFRALYFTRAVVTFRLVPRVQKPLRVDNYQHGIFTQRNLYRAGTTAFGLEMYMFIVKRINPGLLVCNLLPTLSSPAFPVVVAGYKVYIGVKTL